MTTDYEGPERRSKPYVVVDCPMGAKHSESIDNLREADERLYEMVKDTNMKVERMDDVLYKNGFVELLHNLRDTLHRLESQKAKDEQKRWALYGIVFGSMLAAASAIALELLK
jgi:hypothetical protein